jgi:hypothetical protein
MKAKVKILLFLGLILSIFGLVMVKKSWRSGDFSMLVIKNSGLEMVNISPNRGMVNRVLVDEKVEVWIPGGMGWYPAGKIKLILETEKEKELLGRKIAFYNFGFWPDKIIVADNWQEIKILSKTLGPVGVIRYWLLSENWIQKDEIINKPLTEEKELLAETMLRDMANDSFYEKNVKVNIVNASGKNGFGNFIADKVEWMGGTVVSVTTGGAEKGCLLTGKDLKNINLIWNCEVKNDDDNEIKIILGEELEGMVKYSQTYVRSF